MTTSLSIVGSSGCYYDPIEIKEAFTFAKANEKDADGIDMLMSTEGILDYRKIVILPHKFRRGTIESAIKDGRFFVARDQGSVVGYKKLFVLKNVEEQNDMMANEIRCVNGILVDAFSFTGAVGRKLSDPPPQLYNKRDLCIYDGADFTKNSHRGQRINPELTQRAFALIREDAKRLIQEKQAKRLVLLYGLTHLNDYDDRGEGTSRTPSILKAFRVFAKSLTGVVPKEVLHYRYKAFMPTFDLNSQVCKPRLDSESIPGYGNVLIMELPQ
ncbi:MAG: hypothetical protein ACK5MA_05975 [Parachlamydiaceae bacterium]